MNSLIRKILCVVMTLTLITGIFTGCHSGDTKWYLANDISLKTQYGALPEQGTVGDLEYRICPQDAFSCYRKECGYYIDQLEQLDTPYFIVITSGSKTTEGAEISIVDLGMDGTTLQILVEEKDASLGKFVSTYSPCVVLEVNKVPAEIVIHSTTGKEFKHITFD